MANEELAKCYGTLTECAKRSSCELGEPCFNRANEERENRHYHFQNISVPFMLFDPNEEEDGEKNSEENDLFQQISDCRTSAGSGDIVLEGISIPEESVETVFRVLEKIAEFYFFTPKTFHALMNKIFRKKSQSDIAEEQHISRQCVNKRLLGELKISQKRHDIQQRRDEELAKAKKEYSDKVEELREQDAFLKTLSDRDWMIYKLAFCDGCSRGSIAVQLRIGTATVSRVIQFLRSNLDKNDTIKRGRKKKSAKNSGHH